MPPTIMPKPLLMPCYFATGRQVARAISLFYGDALRPADIEGTHFTLAMLIESQPGLTSGEIGKQLIMDKTTLTRTLKLMKQLGLIEWTPGEDRREKRWSLTAEGQARLRKAQPLWLAAQERMHQRIGTDLLATWRGLSFHVAAKLAGGAEYEDIPSSI